MALTGFLTTGTISARRKGTFRPVKKGGRRSHAFVPAMSYYGLSRLVAIHATINSRRYRRILDAGLRPFVAEFAPQDWIFQQDNAPAHVAHDNSRLLF